MQGEYVFRPILEATKDSKKHRVGDKHVYKHSIQKWDPHGVYFTKKRKFRGYTSKIPKEYFIISCKEPFMPPAAV